MSGRDLTDAELDAALASAFGRQPRTPTPEAASREPADRRTAALVEAGLTEATARRVLSSLAEGMSPGDAVMTETAFSPFAKVTDQSVPLETVRARAVAALTAASGGISPAIEAGQPATAGDDGRLREGLRAALVPLYGASAGGVADGCLRSLKETAVREGLTRQQFEARAYALADRIAKKRRAQAVEKAARPVTVVERGRR